MACILHIETSTQVCSVAVSQDGAVIFHKEDMEGPNHARILGGFVDEALSFADSHAIPFDAVAVSSGPGSYTGLRIGVSMAKGICYSRDLKLISVPTLKVMCVPLLLGEQIPEGALLCPMMDARRMEVYMAVYDRGLRPHVGNVGNAENFALVLDENSLSELLEEHEVYCFGNGAGKFREVQGVQGVQEVQEFKDGRLHFIDGIVPLAKNMMPLAEKKFLQEDFENVAYFEPFYLKEWNSK